ncbi:MAG: hypothetical protein KDC44_02105 [Phaeodactylibacter sp.]|nr:hypothetical protein [Phaeodactylibacter sp.]
MKVSNIFKTAFFVFCAAFFAVPSNAQVAQGETFFAIVGAPMTEADRGELLNILGQIEPTNYYVEFIQGGVVEGYGEMSLEDLTLIVTEINDNRERYFASETTVVNETIWKHKDAVQRVSDGETEVVHKTIWKHKDAAVAGSTQAQLEALLSQYE